jgi:hypothetical protein
MISGVRGGNAGDARRSMLVLSLGVFAWFFPILSAATLHKGVASFEDWMWLASWR